MMHLVKYDAACRAIAEARAVDEVKGIHDAAKAMAAAARIARNKQSEADMMEIRFRAERRLGELMAMQRDAGLMSLGGGDQKSNHRVILKPSDPTMRFRNEHEDRAPYGPPERPISLSEAGIDKNLAHRARAYAAIPDDEFNNRVDEYRRRVVDEGDKARADLLAAGSSHVRGTFGTGENEWYTPAEYLELARKVLGGFDLDPASSDAANFRVNANEYFTLDDDGLKRDWFGSVWLNPPYSQPDIANFANKMVSEWQAQRVTAAIVLTHNYTDTSWFHNLANSASALCFTKGRIRFVSSSGELASPTQGQTFFYFGRNVEAFSSVFRSVGIVTEVRQ